MDNLVKQFLDGNPELLTLVKNVVNNSPNTSVWTTNQVKSIWEHRLCLRGNEYQGFEKTQERLKNWKGSHIRMTFTDTKKGIQVIFTSPAIDYIIGITFH